MLLSFAFRICSCANNRGMSLARSVSTAICTIGSLYAIRRSVQTHRQTKRRQRWTCRRVAQCPHFHYRPFQTQDPEHIPRGNLLYRGYLATHQNEELNRPRDWLRLQRAGSTSHPPRNAHSAFAGITNSGEFRVMVPLNDLHSAIS